MRNTKHGGNSNKSKTRKYDSGKKTSNEKFNSTNDPSWYASDPNILRDAASIPFSWSLGTNLPRGGEGEVTYTGPSTIPGIMRVDVTPTMGLSATADSALNTAATAMYSYIRAANSGHANYEAPDLMLYCGAMAQVYAFINWCQRLYGLTTLYAQKNRYLPKALLASMGVDPESLINNLANFRYWINVMVSKASSMAVPATMTYFQRSAFMYAHIYCESDQIKDQLYYFHPASWYKFRFDSSTTSGKLESVQLVPTGTSLKLAEIQRFGEELLGQILPDEDFNIMSGDILKAYGINGIIKLTSIDEYYPVVPIHDPIVLEQIHNATAVEVTNTDVVQSPDKGYLLCQPCVNSHADIFAATVNKILTVDVADPSPEHVIECTRLMVAADSSRSIGSDWYVGCGSEVVTSFKVFTLSSDGGLKTIGYRTAGDLPSTGPLVSSLAAYAPLHCYKYAPTVYAFDRETKECACVFESIDNYAVLNPMDIYKLHDVALMNMLAVPSIAKVSKV